MHPYGRRSPFYQARPATYSSPCIVEPPVPRTDVERNHTSNQATIERATDRELAQSIAESRLPRTPIPPAPISPDLRRSNSLLTYQGSTSVSRSSSRGSQRRQHHYPALGFRGPLVHASAGTDSTRSASTPQGFAHVSHSTISATTSVIYSRRSASSALSSHPASSMRLEQSVNSLNSTPSGYPAPSVRTMHSMPSVHSGSVRSKCTTSSIPSSVQSAHSVNSMFSAGLAQPGHSVNSASSTAYSARSGYSSGTLRPMPLVHSGHSVRSARSGHSLYSARSMPSVRSVNPIHSTHSTRSRESSRSKHSGHSVLRWPGPDAPPKPIAASEASSNVSSEPTSGYGRGGLHKALLRPANPFQLDNPCGYNNVICYLFHNHESRLMEEPATVTQDKLIAVYLFHRSFDIKRDKPVTLKDIVMELHQFLHKPLTDNGPQEADIRKPPEDLKKRIKARAKKWLGSRQHRRGSVLQRIDYICEDDKSGIYLKGLPGDDHYLIILDEFGPERLGTRFKNKR